MGNCNSGAAQLQNTEGENLFVVPEANFSMQVRTVRRFGWKKDLPDHRDRVLVLPEARTKDPPPRRCDLRPLEHFPCYDQQNIGSCTANAICAIFHYAMVKQGIHKFPCSRLFLYYCERAMENTIEQDSGAYLRDGCTCCQKLGLCPEDMWPYDCDKFIDKPPAACYTAALKCKALEYCRVEQTLEALKGCINLGFPFCFGFLVLSSFMTEEVAKTGCMCMPQDDDYILGGHAVCCFGYDDDEECFIIRNSWGPNWGINGYFKMPYAYMLWDQLCQDFWVIKCVEDCPDFQTRRM